MLRYPRLHHHHRGDVGVGGDFLAATPCHQRRHHHRGAWGTTAPRLGDPSFREQVAPGPEQWVHVAPSSRFPRTPTVLGGHVPYPSLTRQCVSTTLRRSTAVLGGPYGKRPRDATTRYASPPTDIEFVSVAYYVSELILNLLMEELGSPNMNSNERVHHPSRECFMTESRDGDVTPTVGS